MSGNKILIVYYSLTGNTKAIAKTLEENLNADILEIQPTKTLNPESATKFMWGGFQATMNKIPELVPYNVDLDQYDLVILGSPVWAWTLSPPIRAFLKENDLTGKKIAVWMCAMGSGKKALVRFKKALPECELLAEIAFNDPRDGDLDSNKAQAIEWAKKLNSKKKS